MNNPLGNFDLSLFLENLPNTLQRPMTVAVGASILTHGLVLVGLPLITGAADTPEKPDRIVNVITLTPEEQAQLPQASPLITPMPQMPLSLGTNGSLSPLTGLMPTPSPLMPSSDPSKNPYNNPFSQPNLFTEPPLIQVPEPIIIYRDRPEAKDEKKPDEKKPDEKKPDENTPDEKKPDEAASSESPTVPKLPSGVMGTEGPIAAKPNGADDLKDTKPATESATQPPLTPAQIAAIQTQTEIRIATTYNAETTTPEAGQDQNFKFLGQLGEKLATSGMTNDELKKLWSNPVKVPEIALTIPQTSYKFDQAKPVIVQAVLDPNDQLLLPPKAIIGSGYGFLDKFAEDTIRTEREKRRKTEKPSGKYQIIQYLIKFVISPATPPAS